MIKIKLLENLPQWESGIYWAEIVEMNCVKITKLDFPGAKTRELYLKPEQYQIVND
jgi:hypothetical protein